MERGLTSHASTLCFFRMLGMLAMRSERQASVMESCSRSEGSVTYCGSFVEVDCAPIVRKRTVNALYGMEGNIFTYYSI